MTDIERALGELDPSRLFPATPDVESAVRRAIAQTEPPTRRAQPRQLRRTALTVAAIVIAATVTLMAASAGARSTLLELLGLEGTTVERGEPSTRNERPPALGRAVSLAEAERLADFEAAVPPLTALGPPTRVRYDPSVPPSGQISLTWGSLVLSEAQALGRPTFGKVVPADARIEAVEIDGQPGYWLSGSPHEVFRLLPPGTRRRQTARLAGDTLLWERGGLLLRLEGAGSKLAALAIARSMR